MKNAAQVAIRPRRSWPSGGNLPISFMYRSRARQPG